ncbi:MAG: hypothetical protein GX564_05060 [Oligosphaeraceae bacterium]|nr:hypothetical protein [Oligosphaeraceae bacterium]
MKKIFSFGAILWFLTWSLLSAQETMSFLRSQRLIYCPQVAAPLPIEGQVSSGGWELLPSSGAFVKTDSLWLPFPVQTSVKIARDQDFLYLGMEMEEPEQKNLLGREKFSMWSNDTIEVFLQTAENQGTGHWYHLAVDSAGRVYWARENEVKELQGTYHGEAKPHPGLQVATSLGPAHWYMTAAIPVALLGGSDWSKSWKVNFGRTRRVPFANSSWSRTKAFQDYHNFGQMIFADEQRARDNDKAYTTALNQFQKEKGQLIASFKARTYAWKYAFGRHDGYRPLEAGYSSERGYGWLEGQMKTHSFEEVRQKLTPRMQVYDFGPLGNQLVYSDGPVKDGQISNHFQLDLPNGKYKVHLLAGLFPSTRTTACQFSLTAQGQTVQDFALINLHYARYFFPVEVQDGKLLLGFSGEADFPDRPGTAAYAPGSMAKTYTPGWAINAIVVYPYPERVAAEAQLQHDEIEILNHLPEELANYQEVLPQDPEPAEYPESWRQAGFAIFSRPLGERLYPGSRPLAKELLESLQIRAVAGEPLYLSFGFLPLRDLANVSFTLTGTDFLSVNEAVPVAWPLGAGKYAREPWYLDEYQYQDQDFTQGQTRYLWLAGALPEDTRPGIITAALQITPAEQETVTLPLKIEVLPFTVQKKPFGYGGYNPPGYGRPAGYEDLLAETCRKYSLNAHVLYLNPQFPDSWQQLLERVKIYQRAGVPGPFVVYCSINDTQETRLKKKTIEKLPDSVLDDQLAVAKRFLELMQEPGFPELIYTAMDEAHCKGEPYWSEQIRLFKTIKEAYPALRIAASESERSYQRSAPYVDLPIVFEIPDFRTLDYRKTVWSYPNQCMLEVADINAGRFCTGWLPALTGLNGIVPWMLFSSRPDSGLRSSPWTLLVQLSVGGYRIQPRLVTVMGQIGIWDQYYALTLKSKIAAAQQSSSPARQKLAAELQDTLTLIAEGCRPSYMYYYHNGYWPASTFVRLREIVTDGILKLDALEKP